MDEVITTIYYDGQFWAALVEKISSDGTVRVGRHVFGSEPDNGDILRFYRDVYDDLPLRRTEGRFRIKKKTDPRGTGAVFLEIPGSLQRKQNRVSTGKEGHSKRSKGSRQRGRVQAETGKKKKKKESLRGSLFLRGGIHAELFLPQFLLTGEQIGVNEKQGIEKQ